MRRMTLLRGRLRLSRKCRGVFGETVVEECVPVVAVHVRAFVYLVHFPPDFYGLFFLVLEQERNVAEVVFVNLNVVV